MSTPEDAHHQAIAGAIVLTLARLRQYARNTDFEEAHKQADDALCDLLEVLGYGEVVDEYRKIKKYYA